MTIEPGSRWRNKRSGVVSEVLRVDGFNVVLRRGKKGERLKYRQHFELDYEPESTPAKSASGVSHKEARAIAQRLIDAAFGNAGREAPRFSIPADSDRDDDLRLMQYIEVCGGVTFRPEDDHYGDKPWKAGKPSESWHLNGYRGRRGG